MLSNFLNDTNITLFISDYCEAGFATRSLGDHVITFTREGNIAFGCDFAVKA